MLWQIGFEKRGVAERCPTSKGVRKVMDLVYPMVPLRMLAVPVGVVCVGFEIVFPVEIDMVQIDMNFFIP
jgi:hypothetical protein